MHLASFLECKTKDISSCKYIYINLEVWFQVIHITYSCTGTNLSESRRSKSSEAVFCTRINIDEIPTMMEESLSKSFLRVDNSDEGLKSKYGGKTHVNSESKNHASYGSQTHVDYGSKKHVNYGSKKHMNYMSKTHMKDSESYMRRTKSMDSKSQEMKDDDLVYDVENVSTCPASKFTSFLIY